MKYYIIAGEASGDLHGANLMKELLKIDKNAEFRFWGGDLMSKYGGEPVKHINELAFMGIIKVIANIRTIAKNINLCKNDIKRYNPNTIILIDYAGFNLKIAKFAKVKGIFVNYYISPKIWAWKTNRIKIIKKYVDKMYSILPFENDFYSKYNYKIEYVGNPINDAIQEYKETQNNNNENFLRSNNLTNKPIIALLAGSRVQEIEQTLPLMVQISNNFPDYQFIIAGAPSIKKELYNNIIQNKNVKIVYNQTYNLLQNSKAAIVTSGTATLETALFKIPQIVCYKTIAGDTLYKIGRALVKTKWISLVNLILNYEAVKELLQTDFNEKNIVTELNKILNNKEYRHKIIESYNKLQELIGTNKASKKTAQSIYNTISK